MHKLRYNTAGSQKPNDYFQWIAMFYQYHLVNGQPWLS
jgi:hypothetical protein